MQSHLTCHYIEMFLYIHQIYNIWISGEDKALQTWIFVNYVQNSQKRNKIRMHSITYSHIWYFGISLLIIYTINESLVEIYNNSGMNVRQKFMKILIKRIKIKERSITCYHIWHVDIPKCVYSVRKLG